MAFKRRAVLPNPTPEYDPQEESQFRADVEDALDDSTDNLSSVEEVKTKAGSLALRRFQFLLMGAGE